MKLPSCIVGKSMIVVLVMSMQLSKPALSTAQSGIYEPIPDFAVFSMDVYSREILADILAGDDEKLLVTEAETVKEAIASKAEVIVLLMEAQTESSRDVLEALKSCKVIGIGDGAARLFGELGLEINNGACASFLRGASASINVESSILMDELALEEPIVAFSNLVPFFADNMDTYFAMYIPRKSHLCSVVDVIARESMAGNYAPIVRQGNYIMIGIAAPTWSWTPAYKAFFRDLAIALHAREPEPFSTAKWEITKPGTYEFGLAEGGSIDELSRKTFYFQFTVATTLSVHLEHEGSNNVMLLFGGGSGEHWTRQDARQGEPLGFSIHITDEDIQITGDRYWRLDVTNFDQFHTADCSLVISQDSVLEEPAIIGPADKLVFTWGQMKAE